MPTINQLVRNGRTNKSRKSKSPVLGIGLNSKDKKQTKGKTRLNNMLKAGKPLKIFSIKNEDLETFKYEAKKYAFDVDVCPVLRNFKTLFSF